ncbi:NAD(P)H-dependent oxidoreductase [Methylovulum miyakonense]|uniref:NAD(P)H-dependent oxidoreductase n=1 Tax=Methylovulum miyakonense TaxID=645578 RepID=UPI000367480F|nr:NAD(P)H-dependent oxidoreductase [Methylovulum miyakonense]
MQVLIVHAHPEPNSFNGALTRCAVETLASIGHQVVVSDLYAMGFDPVSGRQNFTHMADPNYFRLQTEEKYASATNGYHSELQAEMDKLVACDLLIFQFPMWWLGLPAILKGWVDRVFAVGRVYGGGRYFNQGMMHGKRAMCSITIGGAYEVYSSRGVYADIAEILFPLHRGIFGFTGFEVLESFVVYGLNGLGNDERIQYLENYRLRLLNLDQTNTIPMPNMDNYEKGIFKQ